MTPDTDRIERKILLQATPERVWRALADAEQFGHWFGADLRGCRFEPGQRARGPITIAGYEHVMFDVWIERMEPQRLMSWRWHPAAVEPGVDYSGEPTTLVVFELQQAEGGTLLSVVESGFDKVPPQRRMSALRMNTAGWQMQMENIARYVAAT